MTSQKVLPMKRFRNYNIQNVRYKTQYKNKSDSNKSLEYVEADKKLVFSYLLLKISLIISCKKSATQSSKYHHAGYIRF